MGPAPSDELLVALARRYLVARDDQTLGLAPTRLLPARKARTWILFWTAARRVDDSVETGQRSVESWRAILDNPGRHGLAERCIQSFLRRPEGAGTASEVRGLLEQGLDGLAREAHFSRPRKLQEYLDLIHDKSGPAMLVLNRLLFPGEASALLTRHAQAFAATTQIGDDCRDVRRDLAGGRCFVTLEELRGQRSLPIFARSPAFAAQRASMAGFVLARADALAGRFRLAAHRAAAAKLSGFWRHAIESGQVAPTGQKLRLPKEPVEPAGPVRKLGKTIQGILDKRFPAP